MLTNKQTKKKKPKPKDFILNVWTTENIYLIIMAIDIIFTVLSLCNPQDIANLSIFNDYFPFMKPFLYIKHNAFALKIKTQKNER